MGLRSLVSYMTHSCLPIKRGLMDEKIAKVSEYASYVQEILATEVRTRLAEINVRQKDLAQDLGITEKHLSQMLTGKAQGTLAMWERVFMALFDYEEDK